MLTSFHVVLFPTEISILFTEHKIHKNNTNNTCQPIDNKREKRVPQKKKKKITDVIISWQTSRKSDLSPRPVKTGNCNPNVKVPAKNRWRSRAGHAMSRVVAGKTATRHRQVGRRLRPSQVGFHQSPSGVGGARALGFLA